VQRSHMGDERALAEQLQRDQVLATRALAALMRNELPEQVRSRAHQAVDDGTGHVELRADRDGADGARARAVGFV